LNVAATSKATEANRKELTSSVGLSDFIAVPFDFKGIPLIVLASIIPGSGSTAIATGQDEFPHLTRAGGTIMVRATVATRVVAMGGNAGSETTIQSGNL
jgi:hypothetical protein